MTKVTTFTEYDEGDIRVIDVHNDQGLTGTLRINRNTKNALMTIKYSDQDVVDELHQNDALANFLPHFFNY